MKTLTLSTFAALSLLMVTGCGNEAGSTAGGKKTFTLQYSVFFPPTHVQAKLATEWAEEIKRRTDGQVRITIFPGGALTKADQCYQGVVDGISDIGMSAFAYTRGRFPLMELLDLPVGYPDGVSATRIANELYTAYQPKELESTKVMYVHAHGPGILASQKPIKTLADLPGLKIRATGFSAKVVEQLGGSPISMPQGETYEALQKGVVDSTFCPIETLKGWKQGEVIKFITDSSCVGYTTVFFVTMNLRTWQQLPPEIQKIIEQVNAEWIVKHGQAWNEADEAGLAFVKELKHEVISLSADEQTAWRKKIEPLLKDNADKVDKKGLPGTKFLADLQKKIEKKL
jgi:TRAP-type C4-dicarboxylate transport system substrate-binding protein